MGTRPDGRNDLLGFGCGENELHVLRRLFDDLEQGVEPTRGHHVGLVDDEDLVAIAGGGENSALPQIARVVDPTVAGRVNLDHIQRSTAISRQFDTRRTHTARSVGRPVNTVEAARQNASARGLAASTGPAEQVGMIHAIGAQSGAKRVGHLRLPDQFDERLGSIAAVESGDHLPRVVGAGDARPGL